MTENHKEAEVRSCPTCDYRGDLMICPRDGSDTLLGAVTERVGGNTDSPAARAPTLADVSDVPGQMLPSIPPRGGFPSGFALTHADDAGDSLRGDEYGQWSPPEVGHRESTLVGRSIGGRYVIKGPLGRGGMGAVYLAEQPSVKRTVALKVLHREYAENPSIVRRFHQEAMAASRLNHPNTISVYDFGQSDGLLYIAMEHLKGQTLHAATQAQKGLSVSRSLNIMRQTLKSVGEAHRQGIIHRDLKPENIFLTEVDDETDFVKVLDFGVAKLRQPEEEQATLTQAGSVFGTPRYMAPEQSKDVSLDHRADLYSLGIIFFEVLMGRVPFDSDNPLNVMLAHSSVAPPRFRELRPDLDIPANVEAVVFKALAKDRARRYQSADEMAEDIDRLIIGVKSGSWTGDSILLPKLDVSLTGAGITIPTDELAWALQSDEQPERRASGRSGVVWTLALAATALAIGLWWFSTNTSPSTSESPKEPPSTAASSLSAGALNVRADGGPSKVTPIVDSLDAAIAAPTPPQPLRRKTVRRRSKTNSRGGRPRPVVQPRPQPRVVRPVPPKAEIIRRPQPVDDSDPFDSLETQ